MVDFSKPGAVLATVIIAVFAISMFATLLYAPGDGGANGTSPTPSATATPGTAFTGSGRGEARVTALLNQFLVQCNASSQPEVSAALQGVQGFSSVFVVSNDLLAASLNSSIAGNSTAAEQAAFEAQVVLSEYCSPRLLQKGAVQFEQPIVLLADQGEGNRTLFPREIDSFASTIGSPLGIPVYLQPGGQVNSSIAVVVSAQLSQDRLSQWFGQQPDERPTEQKAVALLANLVTVYPRAAVLLQVTWEGRRLNSELLRSQANASKLYSLASFDYSPSDTIVFENVSQNDSQRALELLRNQSFVIDAFEQGGSVVAFVNSSYTDVDEVAVLAFANNLSGHLVLPNSTVQADASFANLSEYDAVAQEISSAFGPDAEVFLQAIVSPNDRVGQSRKAGVALPAVVPALISPLSKEAFLVPVEMRMVVQGSIVLRSQARQIPVLPTE